METFKKDFDPEKEAKSWNTLDLEAAFGASQKGKKVVAKKTIVKTKDVNDHRVKNDVKLILCDGFEFSMTLFDKVNKGFVNNSKVNCFMNVCL